MDRLLVAGLLSVCAGTLGDGESVKIQAIAGHSVILPCHISVSDDPPTVEWSKAYMPSGIAFVYRDGCEIHEMKHSDFQYRTSLIMNQVSNGNASLRISDVRLSDAGRYTCKTIQGENRDIVGTVNLSVVAVSEPKLWVVGAEDWKMTLQCEASGWFPEPTITFLDDLGKDISGADTKTDQDFGRGFNVTRRLTLQTPIDRITCRVHQPQVNQTRVAEIFVPVNCMSSCIQSSIITAAATISVCVLAVFGYIKCGRSAGGQKSTSDQSPKHANSESSLQRIQDDNIRKATAEKEKRKAVSKPPQPPSLQLPSNNSPKPEASTSTSKPPKSGSSVQNEDSKPLLPKKNAASGSSTLKSKHTSPALLTGCVAAPSGSSSSSASTSGQSHAFRPRTLSEPWPRPGGARPQFGYTSYNRYSLLETLGDDMEVDSKQ
uniref:butyrophilin subfamily 3 member A2-like isoform X2 n=1 Tax=Scatophagus argus TaxID=75038 RepID=UPI001ED82455|nr:butyrophilin subfamily 3 member A2-like isoform X2 [Scatophagus argus]